MSILITGGTGYIGSHTAVELLNNNEKIIVLDNFCNSSPEVVDKIKSITKKDFKFYEADILDEEKLEEIFKNNKIESVIHFAGLKAVGESVQKPLEYYYNNISGTLNLLKVMRKYNCKNIVFSSSVRFSVLCIIFLSSLSINLPFSFLLHILLVYYLL